MKKKATDNSFLHRTVYPGGVKALREFVDANLKFPEDAVSHGIDGIVTVTFDVDYKGYVSNTHIKHGIGFGCDEEAIRLVSLLKYTATKNRGLRVVFHQTINIHFNLKEYLRKKNQEEIQKDKQQQPMQITYTITSSTQKPATNSGYTITINKQHQ